MNSYLSQLNKLTENKYNYIRVYSVNLHIKDTLIDITLLIPQNILDLEFNEEDKKLILDASSKIIPFPFKVKINYKKSFADTTFILRDILDYINSKFPALNSAIKESSISISLIDGNITITLSVEQSAESYLKHSGAEDKIKSFLSHRYCNNIVFLYVTREDTFSDNITIEEHIVTSSHFIEVNEFKKLIGKEISSQPMYIKNIKEESNRVVICGRIKGLNRYNKKDDNSPYYTFNIDDTSSSLKALYFPKLWQAKEADSKAITRANKEYEKKLEILDQLLNDSSMGDYSVICEGNVKLSNNNEITLFINNISSCKINFASIKSEIVKKKVPDTYTIVFPKTFIDTFKRTNVVVPNYLKNKRIVVFDFETTGVDPTRDTPIELGAVSIVNGEITEEFSSYINPKRDIPEEITRLTHISNTDVIDAPYIEDVIPDFYKFCQDSIMVAHNAEFDYAFLKNNAHSYGYIFDNERQDTLTMSRRIIKGLEKYSLENICKHLNINNEGAHRAIYDAIATARLYIILIERM